MGSCLKTSLSAWAQSENMHCMCALIIHVAPSPRECPGIFHTLPLYAGNRLLLLLLISAIANICSMKCQSPETASKKKKVIPGQIRLESGTYRTHFEFVSVSIWNTLRRCTTVTDNLLKLASTKPLSNRAMHICFFQYQLIFYGPSRIDWKCQARR